MPTLAAFSFAELMDRGGVVMWPLLVLSIIAVTLILERTWFYLSTNGPARRERIYQLGKLLRASKLDEARKEAKRDRSVYGSAVSQLLEEAPSESAAVDAVEAQRGRLERFLPMLSTIITAAPMLGILGTVIGIIGAFNELSGSRADLDLSDLGGDIGQALITTAAGITVALLTLLPYNLFRAQADRSLSRLESLVAAALSRSHR
ncbi:MAG: MotA/TolQ/ExbB proton channel family protein [Phycisphaeraceae bacterium]|nr:MotA/TolQ/ExbB proton channel family protein [Phycisphaeraceae bacterium]